MEFIGLQYFCAVVQEGSISKAAERLYITQQSLSGYISRLEHKYNCIFFERRPKFRLTIAGEQFYTFAKRVIDENAILKENFASRAGMLRRLPIGICYNNENCILPAIAVAFRKIMPHILLSVVMTARKQEERHLKNMDIYCNISTSCRGYPGIKSELLLSNTVYGLIPDQFLLAYPGLDLSKPIPLRQLLQLPIVLSNPSTRFRIIMDKYCEEQNFVPNIVIESNLPETSFEFVSHGLACCIIPKIPLYYILQNYRQSLLSHICIAEIDVDGCASLPGAVNILYRDDISLPDYANRFIQCAKEVCSAYDTQVDTAIQASLSR